MSPIESTSTENIQIDLICELAVKAGHKIMEIYGYSDFSDITQLKEDQSPLTLADHLSNEVITKGLHAIYPHIPVLSEEGSQVSYPTRSNWPLFWLVDPLDGTKEFIKRNGEFTVNIALIENNKPVLGVIYAPVLQTLYYGAQNKGVFKKEEDHTPVSIKVNRKTKGLISVGSRSHADPAESQALQPYDIAESISIGSSLKFCLIAEGKADIYYRHGPTMEWDTAAGQAIVEAAGGKVLDAEGRNFTYNKLSLLNGSFLCQGF